MCLPQTVEYRINKGTSGLVKVVTHQALEWFGPTIHRQSTKIVSDADNELRVPVMPPTTTGICDPINISYAFQVREKIMIRMESTKLYHLDRTLSLRLGGN